MAARPKLREMDHQRWAREEAAASRPGPAVQFCAVCRAPAPFGFGVTLHEVGLWSCRDHRADVETMAERT
jgi:hypothetical protein